MQEIIIASKNEGKVAEIRDLFSDLPFFIYSLKDIGAQIDVVEDQPDFAGNSFKKAKEICLFTGRIALADDSGLEVEALGGRPGVLSARFAGERATDQENNSKLLDLMKDIEENKRSARFRCVATLYFPDGHYLQAEGTCHGRIGFSPRGNGGFGYDPLFIIDAYGKTMAELSMQEKNAISHRSQALRALKKLLESDSMLMMYR